MKNNNFDPNFNNKMLKYFTGTADQSSINSTYIVDYGASSYRLVRRNGELTLQGYFQWTRGSEGGFTWKDIPTVDLD